MKKADKERLDNFNTFISNNLIKRSTKANLVKAMRHAIDVIESYQFDAHRAQPVLPGFCQGSVYEHAKPTIAKILFNVMDEKI